MTNKKETQTNPVKTGYKKVDAVIYVFDFIFDSAKKDIRVFVVTTLFLMNIAGWGCFVWQVITKDKAIKEYTEKHDANVQLEKAEHEKEKNLLRVENTEIKKEFVKRGEEFKAYQKECNKKTEQLLERLIKNGKK